MWPIKNAQYFRIGSKIFPLWIGLGNMADQNIAPVHIGFQFQGNVGAPWLMVHNID